MKKLKVEALTTKSEVLSKEQLKKILGGLSEQGTDCQAKGSYCSSPEMKNCCNGLVCTKDSSGNQECKEATDYD